jgi:hypothetical protein
MRLRRLGILGGIVGLGLVGCEDPGELTSVSPPGAPIIRTSPDAEPAQAQGEMAAPISPTATSPATPTDPRTIKGPTDTTASDVKPAAPAAKTQTETTKSDVKPAAPAAKTQTETTKGAPK